MINNTYLLNIYFIIFRFLKNNNLKEISGKIHKNLIIINILIHIL